jgi:DNA-binding SARP family transcriptional activator
MDFGVLGPLQVSDGDGPVALGGPKPQTVLAVLLAHANQRVSTDRLIDEVYGESPPDAARKSLQSYVAQLRSAINVDGEVLRSDPPGYLLALSSEQLDSLLFEDQTLRARDLMRSDPAQAAEQLRSALALWRGTPFDSLAGDAPSVREEATRLEELRLTAMESRIEADLLWGNTEGLAAELEGMTQANPYRERLWGLYMLALYRTGRQADALQAYSRLRLTLADELGLEPSPDLQQLEDRILSQDPDLTTPLALDGSDRAAAADPAVRNPYKGLRPFSEADAEDFFGRSDLVRQLTERLERRDPSGRLIALVGASGSGKSSVVAAGLIPHVRRGTIPGSDNWQILTMYPGTDPYGNLAKEVSGPEDSPIDVQDRLVGEGIARVLEDRAPDTLLVIDQFEELFTQVTDRDSVDDFLDQLVDAVRDERSGVRVIITIRADFLDKPLEHKGLSELLGASIILVPALGDHEVSEAVVGPATRVGVEVEPELVAALIGDVGSRASSLPLMQFALTDVFERRSDDVLALATYRSVGGLFGALAKRADGMYDQFSESDKETCRQVMLRMVALSEDGGAVRRRVSRPDLSGHDPEALERVIDELGRNRLVTFDRSPSGEPTIEIPHESLAREWPRLRRWIDASRTDLATRARLSRATGEWVESERDDEFLLGGTRLVTARAWLKETDLDPGVAELEFISESEAHERQLGVARIRRRRAVVAVLAAAAAVAGLFGVVALVQRNSAQEQTRLAVAQQLSALALANLDNDPQLSLLLALEAADTTAQDAVVIREAVEALHQSVLASRVEWVAELGSAGDSVAARFSADGSRIAAGSSEGSIHILDADTGVVLTTFSAHEGLLPNLRWTPDGNIVTVGFDDDTVRLWEGSTGTLLEDWEVIEPSNLDVSPDRSMIAASSARNNEVVLLETATGETRLTLSVPFPVGVSFDPLDGSRLAVAAADLPEFG